MNATAIDDNNPIPIDQQIAAIWRPPWVILVLPYGSHWSLAEVQVLTEVGTSEG